MKCFGVATMPKGKRRDHLHDWLSNELIARFDGRIVPIDAAIATSWGQITALVRRKGRAIDVMDGLIAATADVNAMTVVTRDTRDFEASGVTLLNPWT